MPDLVVSETVTIPDGDLSWTAVRGSGPGGQNVNKVASKIDLRFDLDGTQALSADVKKRLTAIAAGRLDAEGRIVITSQLTRDQGRNLEDAREKLALLIRRALTPPRKRKATKPSAGSRRRRLSAKREHAEKKQARRPVRDD